MRPLILAGPTASGKSRLALDLALRDGGCIVNADALQVYRCWRVLTARPDADDTARVPHALYGHVDCARGYSVGAWLADVAAALADARARGLRPIVVGGSGLYLTALTEGLAEVPPVSADWRAASQALIEAGRLDRLIADLGRDDPQTLARLDLRNPRRVQRAWEVLHATGCGLASWQDRPQPALLPRDKVDCVVLEIEKPSLLKRIECRFEKMLENGALQEVATFEAASYDPALPAAQALGRAELAEHLAGRLSLEAAAAQAVIATRRYAKRQRSWFRNRMPDWRRIDASGQTPNKL